MLTARGAAPISTTSGPIAVARLPQRIRASTAFRPLAGPRACGEMPVFSCKFGAVAAWRTQPDVTLCGFPRSVYGQVAGIVLPHKEGPCAFHDLETEMNAPSHRALHPFERVPI